MKRKEKNWALRVLLTVSVVAGMSAPVFSTGAASNQNSHGTKPFFLANATVPALDHVKSVVGPEAFSVLEVREPVLDDTSLDGKDELRLPSQSIEPTPFCIGFSGSTGPYLAYLAEEGLATQMVCCVWRC